LAKCDLAIVNAYQSGALRHKLGATSGRIENVLCDLRSDLPRGDQTESL